MNGQVDALVFLRANSPFAGMAPATLKMIASRCRYISRQAGSTSSSKAIRAGICTCWSRDGSSAIGQRPKDENRC